VPARLPNIARREGEFPAPDTLKQIILRTAAMVFLIFIHYSASEKDGCQLLFNLNGRVVTQRLIPHRFYFIKAHCYSV
jgi:hypothetical protein